VGDKLPDALGRIDAVAQEIVSKAPLLGPLGGRSPSRAVGLSAMFVVGLFLAARLSLEWLTIPSVGRVVIALAPVPALAWLLVAFSRDLAQADELERRIQLEALGLAFPVALIVVMTVGLLQVAVPTEPNTWSYAEVWLLLYVTYLIGLLRARRRYQ
jgi:hypothetical protein